MTISTDSQVIFDGTRRKAVKLIGISNAATSNESAVVKIDKSTLTGPNGNVPSKLVIEEISWDIAGFSAIRLDFDADTDDEIVTLSPGNGLMSWMDLGGIVDPVTSNATGDVVLTTLDCTTNATYTITIVYRLKD